MIDHKRYSFVDMSPGGYLEPGINGDWVKYSDYEVLSVKAESLDYLANNYYAEKQTLESRLSVLTKALEFYADRKHIKFDDAVDADLPDWTSFDIDCVETGGTARTAIGGKDG